MKKLFQEGLIDFYFDTYELRSGKGRGGKLDKFIFRIQDCLPGSEKDYQEQAHMRTSIIETIKATVPSLVSDDIFRQLKELSRTELKDLYGEMSIFKKELQENKIRDARGILWFKLRNRYNINPNGTERLKKNPQNEYPKYKKISEEIQVKSQDEAATKEERYTQAELPFADDKPTWWLYWSDAINDIISNYRVGDRDINENEKRTLLYMFNEKDKFLPNYNGEELRIQIDPNIYKNYVAQPFSPLYEGLHKAIVNSVFKFFPNIKKLSYAVSGYEGGNLNILPIKEI